MERVRLWRHGRHELIGTVELDEEHRRLQFHIVDEAERDYISGAFDKTGEVSWGWLDGKGERHEQRAKPGSPDWFWFVVDRRLRPLGYRADSGASEY